MSSSFSTGERPRCPSLPCLSCVTLCLYSRLSRRPLFLTIRHPIPQPPSPSNRCTSETLGRAVHQAGVPWVVCWSTPCDDEAARLLSVTFFQILAASADCSYEDAFRQATSNVKLLTRPCMLANGTRVELPKFAFRDPRDAIRPAAGQQATRRDMDRAPMEIAATGGEEQQEQVVVQEATAGLADGQISAGLPLLLCPREVLLV